MKSITAVTAAKPSHSIFLATAETTKSSTQKNTTSKRTVTICRALKSKKIFMSRKSPYKYHRKWYIQFFSENVQWNIVKNVKLASVYAKTGKSIGYLFLNVPFIHK